MVCWSSGPGSSAGRSAAADVVVGRFVTFEGGEGAGKSTQVERLALRLRTRGVRVVTTREPGGSPRAERIREAVLCGSAKAFGPLAEALLFSAARIDHLQTTIRPALREGAFVLCDRFADSTRVYQGVLGDLDAGLMRALERVVVERTRPDLTIVLDVPAEVGLERADSRRRARREHPDRFETEGRGFHDSLRRAFQRLAEAEPKRCVLIDGTREPEQVAAAIWSEVERRFPEIVPHHEKPDAA